MDTATNRQLGEKEASGIGASHATFFSSYTKEQEKATQVTHNLLQRINVRKNLQLLLDDPHLLFLPVTVNNRHGQPITGTILQIVATAEALVTNEMKAEKTATPNTSEMDKDEKDYELIRKLLSHGTRMQIGAATEMLREKEKAGKNPYELIEPVELLRICFFSNLDEYNRQLSSYKAKTSVMDSISEGLSKAMSYVIGTSRL